MNELKIFENPTFGQVRIVEREGEPWFVGKDVAQALGYKNPQEAIRTHVDEEDRGVSEILTPGGKQNIPIINESGLYSLVLSSKLPTAKAFKRWITSEVIPSIRKTGGYLMGQEQLSPSELMAKALMVAQKTLAERDARISALTVENQIMTPKAEYFDDLVDRNLLTSFRETAKQLEVKEKAFIAFLLEKKFIYRDKKGKLMPYAEKNNGLFEVKECFNDKTQWSGTQTMITPKGRETFRLLCQGI
ncbi:MAG TPA: phage antirepressor KilAC domain-containing protein [Firmicutes bacterium]|nr:phage antirepressor KilAC domain-containing protein [Bacillota bacterium]